MAKVEPLRQRAHQFGDFGGNLYAEYMQMRKEQNVRPMDLLPKRVELCELAVCKGCGELTPSPVVGLFGTNDMACCHCEKCYAVYDWRKGERP
jgi:hypothetical protein